MVVKDKRKIRLFYGWWIVSAASVAWALHSGFFFYGFGVFFMPLVEEFGWSRAALSGVFSLTRLEGGLIGPIAGFLVDKFGPRKIMIVGITMVGAGFILLSQIDSLLTFCLIFILCIALGGTLSFYQAPLVAITNWFIEKRGTAIGIGMSGIGLGGLLVPVTAWLIVQYDWRQAVIIIGLIFWIIGIPLAFVMRHRPEQYGSLPDGKAMKKNVTQRESEITEIGTTLFKTLAKERTTVEETNFTVHQALRTKVFWLLSLIFGLRQFVISAVVVHQIPLLIGIGISAELASAMLGSMAVISIVGRMGFGRLADIFEKKYLMAVCSVLIALGCFILANAHVWWCIIVFLIIYSPGYGGGSTLMQTIRAEYFGRQHFGAIMGLMNLVQMFGIILGPIFAGWMFDVTGSYRLAFITFGIAATTAAILMLIVRRPARMTVDCQ